MRGTQTVKITHLQAMTARETPQARPRASLLFTKTYGTFCDREIYHSEQKVCGAPTTIRIATLSSQRRGRCRRISRGLASAASTTNSEMPRFSVLVAAHNYKQADRRCQPGIEMQDAERKQVDRRCQPVMEMQDAEPSLAPFLSCL